MANKIGTYDLAVLAHVHNIHFYIAAPLSTFDLASYKFIDAIITGKGIIYSPYIENINTLTGPIRCHDV